MKVETEIKKEKKGLSDEDKKLLASNLYGSEDLQLALKVRKGEAELALLEMIQDGKVN